MCFNHLIILTFGFYWVAPKTKCLAVILEYIEWKKLLFKTAAH